MSEKNIDLGALRRDYGAHGLVEADASADAVVQFRRWFDEAVAAGVNEPNAMTLATASPDGAPSARIVLLKGVDAEGFLFFTNYESDKGKALGRNARAALVFFWAELERQVRVEGRVTRASTEESDRYFASRPRQSQLGAWASPQSQELGGRSEIEAAFREVEARFAGKDVPRPPHWGGFRVAPERVEFWQGRPSRLHDRLVYTKTRDGYARTRLSP